MLVISLKKPDNIPYTWTWGDESIKCGFIKSDQIKTGIIDGSVLLSSGSFAYNLPTYIYQSIQNN